MKEIGMMTMRTGVALMGVLGVLTASAAAQSMAGVVLGMATMAL